MNRELPTRPRLAAIGTVSAAGLVTLVSTAHPPHTLAGAGPAWRRWLWSMPNRSADPLEALAAGARLVAMGVLAYLVLIALANLAQSFVPAGRRRSRTWRAVQSLTPRWLAVASIGVAIGAGPVAAQQPAGPTDGRAAPVMELVDAAPSHRPSGSTAVPRASSSLADPRSAPHTPTVDLAPTIGGDAAVGAGTRDRNRGSTSSMPWASDADAPMIDPSSPLQPISDEAATPRPPGLAESSEQAAAPALPSVDQLPASAAVHRVQPGEHLWSIAEQVVVERDGPTASDAAVADYWRQLIETNRDRLIDPDNPDLILPGQVFDLPL